MSAIYNSLMDPALMGISLNFLGALMAGLAQIPWSRRDVLAEAGFGYHHAATDAETLQLPNAIVVRRRRWITGIGLIVMATGFVFQLVAG